MAFQAHFLNVGCADCTIFELGNQCAIIDCGYRRFGGEPSKPTNIYVYLSRCVETQVVDLFIITHPHHDHYLGMKDLIRKVEVKEFWGSPYERRRGDDSLEIDDWSEYCDLRGELAPSNRFVCSKGVKKSIGECTFTILGPRDEINSRETRECHDGCLVVWVSTPANNFIICGDASNSELDEVRTDWNLSSCTVLRASHHGSIQGANLDFIHAARPRDTIVSTSSGVFSSLPHATALKRYESLSDNVLRTDTNGTVVTPLRV